MNKKKRKTNKHIVTSILTEDFCQNVLEEAIQIASTHRDVTLDIVGINLLEFGFETFLEKFTNFINLMLWSLFASEAGFEGFYGSSMYIVSYEQSSKLPAHPEHVDQCDLTLNLCLEEATRGGSFILGNGEDKVKMKVKKGQCVVHPGSTPHQVTPVKEGRRTHLIIWMKRKDLFPQFTLLPPEIQKEVVFQAAHQVNGKTILRFGQCNKRLHKMCNDEAVWKILVEKLPAPIPAVPKLPRLSRIAPEDIRTRRPSGRRFPPTSAVMPVPQPYPTRVPPPVPFPKVTSAVPVTAPPRPTLSRVSSTPPLLWKDQYKLKCRPIVPLVKAKPLPPPPPRPRRTS